MENTSTQEIITPSLTEGHEYKLEIIPPHSVICCRRADIIYRDGKEIARSYHRHSCVPGDDVSHDCAEVQAVAAALWTPAVVAAYKATLPEEDPAVKEGTSTMPTEELEYKPISELL